MPPTGAEHDEESKPLLHELKTAQRAEIEKLEQVGDGGSSFKTSMQLSVRGAILMVLMGTIIWVPAIRRPFPNDLQARIPLVVCLFVFTINPVLGTSIANGVAGIVGTFLACLHMWVMNGIFPGGMKEGMSPTSSTAIFGWVNMLVFLWLVLWAKCGMGLKMFALATDLGFMLAFLDPKSTLVFSENFTISAQGTAVNTLLATMIACIAAPLLNLVPYPMTFAFRDMMVKSMKASKDTALLFETLVTYYSGSAPSVVIDSAEKSSFDLRTELDKMGASIGGAWWEGFDIGTRGTIRALMQGHLDLLQTITDRLRALLVAVATEDFGPSHITVMDAIRGSSKAVVESTTALLIAVTKAASDGDIDENEKKQLALLIADTKGAVKQLAKDFDKVRRGMDPISVETMGESFFTVSISAYARMVWEYSEMMIMCPPKGAGFGSALVGGLKSTWDMKAMTEGNHFNFVLKHFLAILLCWFYSVYVDSWGGACVITSVFLMSTAVCPDIQVFLNVMNAVILSAIAGSLLYTWSCQSGQGEYVLPIVALFTWIVGLYGYFSAGPLLLPALVITALTPFKLIGQCPEGGDIAAGARALWVGLVGNVVAILIVASCQYFLARDRAAVFSCKELEQAFQGLKEGLRAFWKGEDSSEPLGIVRGNVAAGLGYNSSAVIEPRFWRNRWKGALYDEVVASVRQLRLDILMMSLAMGGSDGKPDSIFNQFNECKEFGEVKKDLNETLEDAHTLATGILKNEEGVYHGIAVLKTTTGIDVLDALQPLIDRLKANLKFPKEEDLADSLEDDELCQISTVFLMLDKTVKHIAALLEVNIRNC